ncbi:MAG TPA: NAD(P)H-dependent glycerol-3-phosphate dehydrogenase [Gammaproteobacteria bacterium]|nr:NAD(P)H-dependent glycerol-3-phosphate dehydrogenase [Gammaproteobacteria bacterium]
MTDKQPILVVGAGSWGTALAITLARNGYPVWMWGRNPDQIEQLRATRLNDQYLPGIELPSAVNPESNIHSLSACISDVVIAVPCGALPAVLDELSRQFTIPLNICLACKGLAAGKQLLNHQVVEDSDCNVHKLGILSGPSFAIEVARGLPTAVTLAAGSLDDAEYFAAFFRNDVFRIYTSDDIIGVQIAGAVKNVMAIAAGISDGLCYGANTRAALVTRGLSEITRLGVALGGRQETFMGLAGVGDLLLTCTDDKSRNRRMGLLLAKGKTAKEAQQDIGQAVEGMNAVEEVIHIAERYGIDMPVSEQVSRVIQGRTTPTEAVYALLAREPKAEVT